MEKLKYKQSKCRKTCLRCLKTKAKSKFSKDKAKLDGLSCYCKACASKALNLWRENNRIKAGYYENNLL